MTYNTDHLAALIARRSNEQERHKGNPAMVVYLAGIDREIKQEEAFLKAHGVETYAVEDTDMSIDDIFAELEI